MVFSIVFDQGEDGCRQGEVESQDLHDFESLQTTNFGVKGNAMKVLRFPPAEKALINGHFQKR